MDGPREGAEASRREVLALGLGRGQGWPRKEEPLPGCSRLLSLLLSKLSSEESSGVSAVASGIQEKPAKDKLPPWPGMGLGFERVWALTLQLGSLEIAVRMNCPMGDMQPFRHTLCPGTEG